MRAPARIPQYSSLQRRQTHILTGKDLPRAVKRRMGWRAHVPVVRRENRVTVVGGSASVGVPATTQVAQVRVAPQWNDWWNFWNWSGWQYPWSAQAPYLCVTPWGYAPCPGSYPYAGGMVAPAYAGTYPYYAYPGYTWPGWGGGPGYGYNWGGPGYGWW